MKFLTLIFAFVFVLTACNTKEDSSDPISPEQAIVAAADSLNKAILTNDYDAYVRYTHPKIVEAMGGAQQFRNMTEQNAKGMQQAGAKFISIKNGEPGKIITMNGELQSTLPQSIDMDTPEGRLRTKTTQIAISNDNGKTWHFIDTFNTDIKQLRTAIPTLSEELVIPPTQRPEIVR